MANGQEGKMARQCWIDLCWQRMSAVMCIVWWVSNRCGQEKIQEVKEKAKRVVEVENEIFFINDGTWYEGTHSYYECTRVMSNV